MKMNGIESRCFVCLVNCQYLWELEIVLMRGVTFPQALHICCDSITFEDDSSVICPEIHWWNH